jgi:murein DD-endopeptidase
MLQIVTRFAPRLIITLWLMAITVLLSGCGAGKKYQPPPPGAIDPKALIQTARSQLGARYHAGGSTPRTGFDCSGYTQWVFRQHGLALPRQSDDQYELGEKVKRNKLRTGDLVFFEIEKKGASHVGIYVDRDLFIHATSSGGRVREDHMDDKYWRKHYLGTRRVLP